MDVWCKIDGLAGVKYFERNKINNQIVQTHLKLSTRLFAA